MAPTGAATRRTAISAEAFGEWNRRNQSADEPQAAWPMSQSERQMLDEALSQARPPLGLYLQDIDQKNFDLILDSFKRMKVPAGTEVIRQGDIMAQSAPGVFVVESGTLEAFVRKDSEAHPGRYSDTYERAGDTFGELAVLYGHPRAATVRAVSHCILWHVDRKTVFAAKLRSAQARRQCYDDLLKGVKILDHLDGEKRALVIDALQPRFFEAGKSIIMQGDVGKDFFLLRDGEAKTVKDGKELNLYYPGSCFGELALLCDQPRAASIVAVTDCECASLDRDSFTRLLGPLEAFRRVSRDRGAELYHQNSYETKEPNSRASSAATTPRDKDTRSRASSAATTPRDSSQDVARNGKREVAHLLAHAKALLVEAASNSALGQMVATAKDLEQARGQKSRIRQDLEDERCPRNRTRQAVQMRFMN